MGALYAVYFGFIDPATALRDCRTHHDRDGVVGGWAPLLARCRGHRPYVSNEACGRATRRSTSPLSASSFSSVMFTRAGGWLRQNIRQKGGWLGATARTVVTRLSSASQPS